jgi:DNA-binding NarL/FixJ family response regulator
MRHCRDHGRAPRFDDVPDVHPMNLAARAPTTHDVRVLTVDDQEPFRGVAREVIDATPGFEAVGEAASGREALAAVERLSPQLVLLDVRMPGMDGIEVARRLAEAHPETVVVLISMEEGIDVPSAAQLRAVPLVRKQDFGPRLLRRLWLTHGPVA